MPPESRNPFEGVTDFFSELHRMKEVALGRQSYEHADEPRQRTQATAWLPAADIFARGNDLVIRLDLAGVNPDDVTISFAHSTISVRGERHTEEETGGPDSFYVRERFYGAFRRAISVPSDVESDQISAEFLDGLVEITVTEGVSSAEPHRIALRDRSAKKPVVRKVAKTTGTRARPRSR
jgi:HSP20 family protein